MAHLSTPLDMTVEEILDRGGSVSNIPSVRSLSDMRETIQNKFLSHIRIRGEVSDRVLRELSKRRKERVEQEREKRERADREAEERKHKLKKVKKRDSEEERPLAVGAHGVARQDGVDVHKDNSSTISSPISQAPPSVAGTAPMDSVPSPSLSDTSHQPAPIPSVPQYQTFGPDPSTFDDPTTYHIREVTPSMMEEEIKDIYCVAEFPESDLHDQTPGTPPDKDFSNAKPASQVNATVFANYVEPYIRPLTEEDVAFLKERGDRVTPFILPRRGPRHYKEIWADEDGAMAIDTNNDRLPPNEPRGSMDIMTDELAETEEISTGPMLARLLSTMRPEKRSDATTNGEINGTTNGDSMDLDDSTIFDSQRQPPATQMPESTQPGWKAPATVGKTDYATLEERIMQEFRHIGFLSDVDTPDYSGHFDDEVAARLRYLQSELRKQSVINGARKARILELTEERMAQQEYNTIADDLDNQLNTAYLKRNRNIGKGKKNAKRPGGAGGGSHPVNAAAGISRPSVGEPIRTLMERKSQWNNTIGPVVNYGKTGLPKDSVFSDDVMKRLMDREQESWNEVEE